MNIKETITILKENAYEAIEGDVQIDLTEEHINKIKDTIKETDEIHIQLNSIDDEIIKLCRKRLEIEHKGDMATIKGLECVLRDFIEEEYVSESAECTLNECEEDYQLVVLKQYMSLAVESLLEAVERNES